MTLDDGKKADVLLAALGERYSALRAIRERVQSIGIASLGLQAAAGGWLLQTDDGLTSSEVWVCLLGLIGAVLVLRGVYLADLQKGFSAQQRTAVKLETALGLFEVDVFDRSGSPMYPASWARAGEDTGSGRFFATTFALIYLGAAFLGLAMIFA
ncbi:hypothetical protein [uncultured Brevundimonas sp.]|uniref:hypothetical protein n=1 Tax=uncultured Brevundimonas sp. TaxID=213418 RepID=UPI0025CDB05D|nr:hypothetical protein [uncultured Brevundimonas sp.]